MASKESTAPSYQDRLDIPSVTLLEAKAQIELSLRHRQRRGCIILVGDSGLGKTQIVSQVARENGYKLFPIHTAQYGLMGAGIPQRAVGNHFDIAVPSVFPQKDDKAIVFFDELNRGQKHSIAMFFTMLEDSRIFNYTLPEDSIVMGAMNPADARYAVTQIEHEPAIRRRVKFFWIVARPQDWLTHAASTEFHHEGALPAKGKACHPDILKYFRANPAHLYDKKALDAGKQYLCPANVQTVSEDAYVLQAEGLSLTSHEATTRFSASIGLTSTESIVGFLKDHAAQLTAEDVLYHPNSAIPRVKGMAKKGEHEKLSSLAENVLTLIFVDLPEDAKKMAQGFLDFSQALPLEVAAAMFYQIRDSSNTETASRYRIQLMSHLAALPKWNILQEKIDEVHRAIEAKLAKAGAEKAKP